VLKIEVEVAVPDVSGEKIVVAWLGLCKAG
jgi:hypothetical protein